MKKIIALLLAALMVIGMFAACTPADKTPDDTKAPETTDAPETTEGDKTDVPEKGDPVELTWYTVGGGTPSNWDSWTAKVNEYLEEKINVHLNYQIIGWGEWGDSRSVIVQTNEPYDLIFTDMGSFRGDIAMGAFAPLDELIAQTPGLTDLIPEGYLDGCRVDGNLYGIPAYKDCSMTNFFAWTKEHVDQWFPEYADAHTLAEIDAGLYAIKEGWGQTPMQLNADGISCLTGNKYDDCALGNFGLGIAYHGGTEFVPVFEQEDVLSDLNYMHKWYNDGIINSDAGQITGQNPAMTSVGVSQGWPAAAKGWGESRKAEVVVSKYEDTVLSTSSVQGSITCINATSEHKLEAMKLLELINTDTKLRDMMWYGEEGVNFEYIEENGETRVQKLPQEDADKWTGAAYTQGTFFVCTPEAGTVGNPFVDEVKVQNENAVVSPAMGFMPNTDAVADQIAACKAVFEDYKSLLYTGAGDPAETIESMMAAMRAAGFDDIQAEINAQFAEWQASK